MVDSEIKFDSVKKKSKINFKSKELKKFSEINTNSPPSVFVGSQLKYPFVNVGILSPFEKKEDVWIYDDAKYWAKNNFKINQVINLRDNLLNSRFKTKVKCSGKLGDKFVGIAQEIAIASKPVDLEIDIDKSIFSNSRKDKIISPIGMNTSLKKLKIVGNTKINPKLDKVINDDLKANESIKFLYKNNFDEYVLSKVLSVGVLGMKKDKKFVPTRWSITATDDLIGKNLIEKIRNYKWIENFEFFFGEFMGNSYLIMFFPNVWNYELFEIYFPGSSWNSGKEIKISTDYESFFGRKNYAKDTAGGYYASRLPVLEYLEKIKRQASVLVIRLELPTYWASLGVWVCRESVRKALSHRKLSFSDIKEMIDSVKKISVIKFGFNSDKIIKNSKILNNLLIQTNLGKWFN